MLLLLERLRASAADGADVVVIMVVRTTLMADRNRNVKEKV